MSPERELEYAELSAFVEVWATDVLGIDRASPAHPSNVLAEVAAVAGRSRALAGLRQAANDVVESVQALAPERVNALDAKLRLAGVVTLSELRLRRHSSSKAILKRGKIRNETEYHLVKGLLDSQDDTVDSASHAALSSMLSDVEHANR